MVKIPVLDVSGVADGNDNAAASEQIEEALASEMPRIIRGFDLGQGADAWSDAALQQLQQEVTVHVCEQEDMDFLSKNFSYKKLRLGELALRAARSEQPEGEFFMSSCERYYLRSLAEDQRGEAADIAKEFPSLSAALQVPQLFPASAFFSSVLRIASANMRLWLHYDIMDNLLLGIRGTKRVTLFSPYDAQYLYLRGDKSLIVNPECCDLNKFPKFSQATPFTGELLPGDILYIPAMWYHSVYNCDFTVSVNVFWRSLDPNLYDPKDVYGNKELQPIARLRQSLRSGCKAASALPPQFKHVYGLQLCQIIINELCDPDTDLL